MPRIWASLSALALAAACLAACSGPSTGAGAGLALARPMLPLEEPRLYPGRVPSFLQVGVASWYGDRFKRRPTASGEPFDPKDITAAHRTLPLGTIARVTNLANGRSILVRINDRGPYAQGRVIDLSRSAAAQLGMKQDGVAQVRIEVFEFDQRPRTAALHS
ncbi:MAG TPA: septal ring lytic transglycosylase RlpA family protein [Stellaceae bacterium]|nr:septal ring lytic transglycosylase RlpA family protein [Stellaceae bacterium]